MKSQGLNIVLIEPEIPQNTGTIGRLCLAISATLHLVEPLGFDIDEHSVRRAGLDYWKYVDLKVHSSAQAFLDQLPKDAQLALIETKANQTIYQTSFQQGHYLIFGRETTGIPTWIQDRYAENIFSIPMVDDRVRSLNLSNAASIVAYEAVRQLES